MARPNSTPTHVVSGAPAPIPDPDQTITHDVEPVRATNIIDLPPPHVPTHAPESGRILLGKYKVQKVIGAGGMGVVYQVRCLKTGRKLALKTLHPDRRPSSDTLRRFVREAELLKKLRHPHIVELIESGKLPNGTPFMVMDLLRGRDLREELRQRGPLPIAEAVGYCLQVTLALDEAHRAGVVHRDIKPQNMFITGMGGARNVKLLDFGISKLADSVDAGLTGTQDVLGTPSYMSPEQVLATREVDRRTDFWSLGVVLYFLLTGRLPFARPSAAATFAAIPTNTPPLPRSLAEHIPKALEAVIMKCLEKSPERRYQSAAELGVALAPFGPLEGASVRVPHTNLPSTIPPVPLPGGDPLHDPIARFATALGSPAPFSSRALGGDTPILVVEKTPRSTGGGTLTRNSPAGALPPLVKKLRLPLAGVVLGLLVSALFLRATSSSAPSEETFSKNSIQEVRGDLAVRNAEEGGLVKHDTQVNTERAAENLPLELTSPSTETQKADGSPQEKAAPPQENSEAAKAPSPLPTNRPAPSLASPPPTKVTPKTSPDDHVPLHL